jgi:Uri superfamily endonuclease
VVLRGAYCLCIVVSANVEVSVGALGRLAFPRGVYVYVGSALNSLEPRITRHIRTSEGTHNVAHWHIDYLLREPAATLDLVYFIESEERMECQLAARVAENGEPVDGFGCSDCRCRSHLYRVNNFSFLEKMGLKKWATGSSRRP